MKLGKMYTYKLLSGVLLSSALLIQPVKAEPNYEIEGEFEYEHASVENGDTTSDLTTAELTFGAEFDHAVSAELTIAGVDEETDEDDTVDNGLEIETAIVSYSKPYSNLTFQVGVWESPVGQVESLSITDPLATEEIETERNRGVVGIWSPIENIEVTAFSGTLDDTASSSVSGANIAIGWEFLTFNLGQISATGGEILDGATAFSMVTEVSDFAFIAEKIEMDNTDNTEFTQFEVNYATEISSTPVTFGVGQSAAMQDSAEDTKQNTYSVAIELTENLVLTLDRTNLEVPDEGDTETTAVKVAFEF